MPNRIIKESICTSDNIDQLTPFQETVFVRLMVNCDDFGRFDGRAKVLSSRLFPLRSVPAEEMEEALVAMQEADLITVYEVDGRPYIQMNTWSKHQTTRAKKSKYPSPDDGICKQLHADANRCNQVFADDSKCPRIRESIYENRYTKNDDDDDLSRAREEPDEYETAVRNAYREHVGRMPSPEEERMISVSARLFGHTPEMRAESIRIAAGAGASSVAAYSKQVMNDWKFEDIRTLEELGEHQVLYDMSDTEGMREAKARRMAAHAG